MRQVIIAIVTMAYLATPSLAVARNSNDGKAMKDRQVIAKRLPPNSEKQKLGESTAPGCAAKPAPALPFAISIDGEQLDTGASPDGATVGMADAARCTDLALERADIRVRYDGGEQTRALNADGSLVGAKSQRDIRFSLYSNYSAFIDRAEIRLFKVSDSPMQKPLRIIDAPVYGMLAWNAAGIEEKELVYVLRVYGKDGQFDETRPKKLALDVVRMQGRWDPLDVYGKSNIGLQNIHVNGGMVTVDGSHLLPRQSVKVLGYDVPVDNKGRFAFRQILPAGPHEINVTVEGGKGEVAEFNRAVTIPNKDWFYVGLADLTIGGNTSRGPVKVVRADASDEFDKKFFVNGRLAFYLKGKVRGDVLLTAAADTREQPLEDLFTNFTSKDPRYLLRRLDPEKYYPVYGDDSTTVDDAPTQGKFYVRLERGDSHVMWGNFKTSINGTDFMQYRRGLYGGKLKWVSEKTTTYGEKRARLDLFAADAGTVPARDEFRGTAGSLYYLHRQDLTRGSEQVWIEVRDKDTGLVLKTTALKAETDYDVNYIQGRIMLTTPLSSTSDDHSLVRTGSLSGYKQYLVVTYEYTPGFTRTEDVTVGGRASVWANDHVQIGATGFRQDGSGNGQKAGGIDATLRFRPGTYVKGEIARSDGVGTGSNLSQDGGYTFLQRRAGGQIANAGRIEAAVDFSEVFEGREGRLHGYWQRKQKGFSSPGHLTGSQEAATEAGIGLEAPLDADKRTKVRFKGSKKHSAAIEKDAIEGSLERKLTDNWIVIGGVRADRREIGSGGTIGKEGVGHRVDLAARAEYRPDMIEGVAPWMIYGFGQGTVKRSKSRRANFRGGFGGEAQVSERIKLKGEGSGGTGGFGALVGAEYKVDENTSLYLNYRLDTDHSESSSGGRYGVLTSGGRTRYNDNLNVFAEERFYHGHGPSGLAHAFGLDFSLYEHWNFGLNAEFGELNDPELGDLDRKAGGVTIGYSRDKYKLVSNLEGRYEDGSNGTRRTILTRNVLTADLNRDLRLLTRYNASWSDSSQGQFYDADYMEGVAAFAYRPVDHDRFNMLFKYTYFMDMPTTGQLDDSGALADYAQRSHILAIDGGYDVLPSLTLGGKYALRVGEMRENRADGDWFGSTAQLGIVRADLHIIHNWDIVVEGRVLDLRDAGDRKYGALAAVYRHVGDHMKIGAGYNFTDFSDDLTDLDYDHRGWMVNLVGKF